MSIKSRIVTVITAVTLSGTAALVPVVAVAQTTTIEQLQAQIAALQAQLNQLLASSGQPPVGAVSCTFTRNLSQGVSGDDVKCLQRYLNSAGYQVAASGVGSPGNETTFFGSLTKAAVAKWQAANGVSPAAGYFGSISRAKYSSLVAAAPAPGAPDVPAPVGTGLTVSADVQPAATLAPQGAASVPFTVFKVTAGAEDVTIRAITVEKRGLLDNAVFSGIVLLDENGVRLNIPRTLGADNRAVIRDGIVVKAGQTRTLTVAGDMAASLVSQAGQVGGLVVVAVDAGTAVINGTFPIVGASHTINASLSLGSVTANKGALDPNAAVTKDLNTKGYTFASVKLTAGSAENVVLRSIRWQQVGSAGAADLANVVVVVDGTEYSTTVSGKYYSVSFGAGISIPKGLSKDVSIKGDIVSGSGRNVQFDLERAADIYVVGSTFGYGLTPTIGTSPASPSTASEFTTAGVPFYDASQITVSKGSMVVSASGDVAVGNVANGASNISLGAFKLAVTGEAVRWTQIKLTIATTTQSGTDGAKLSNLALYRGGTVIAGPQDSVFAASGSEVTFTDSVSLPTGENVIVVKGNLNNNWDNNETIEFSFNPSSAITGLTGDVSTQSITATPNASVAANKQTVKTGALTVGASQSLAAQNVINNSTGVVLGRISLDATASGEDLRISVIKIKAVTGTNADVDELDTIQLFDGATAINTGGNVLNPSGNAGGADANLTFTIDGTGFILAKGTSKILDLKANVKASSTPTSNTTYKFDLSGSPGAWTVTGVSTGKAITEQPSSTAGALMTVVGQGTIAAAKSPADPVEKWYKSGDEAVIGKYRLTSTNEPMKLTKIVLALQTASSSAVDFQSVSLWDGATKLVDKLSPAWNEDKETFDLDALGVSFVVPKNSNKDLIIKAKFAGIGTGLPGVAGHLVRVATTSTATDLQARGLDSGATVNVSGASSAGATDGARYFKAVPEVGFISVSGALSNGTKTLYKHTVKATGNDVGLYKFTYKVATTGVDVSSYKVVEVETGKTVKNGCTDTNGIIECKVESADYGTTEITVPSGTTYTYELTGTVTGASSGDSVTTQLEGDAAYLVLASCSTTCMDTASGVNGGTNDDFIWSDRNATSHDIDTSDWANGFKVPGLPTTNLSQSVLSL